MWSKKRIQISRGKTKTWSQGWGVNLNSTTFKIDPALPPVIHPPWKVAWSLSKWQTKNKNLQDPNKATMREHYPLQTVEVLAEMPNAKFFSVLDANHGFREIQLDEDSPKLWTFNIPFGQYQFKQLPFGVSLAPEVFQKCIAQRLKDVEGVMNVMDDILVWDADKKQHDKRLRQLFDRIRSISLKMNKDICKTGITEIQNIQPEARARKGQSNNGQCHNHMTSYKNEILRYCGVPFKVDSEAVWVHHSESFWKGMLSGIGSTAAAQLWTFEETGKQIYLIIKFYDVNKEVTSKMDASSEGFRAVTMHKG